MKTQEMATPDKVRMFKDHDEVMRRILAESKREIEALQNDREKLTIKNTQLNDEIARKQSQFEQWKRGEEQKMKDVRNKLNNDIIRKEKEIEIGELDLSRRIEECKRREEIGKSAVAKEAKIANDRIEIEKLRSSANLLMNNAERKMSDALSMENQVNVREIKSKEIETKANAINSSIVKREEAVIEKEKEIASATKNFEELKKIVEPKIKEIKELEEKLAKDKKLILEKEQEVERKITEEKVLLRDLEDLKKRLNARSKELDQKDEEITRKALIAGIDAK